MFLRLVAIALLLAPAASFGAGASTPPLPSKGERCGVCGMYVSPFPTWVAALRAADGKVEYFDGPKDMFKRLFLLKGKGAAPQVFVTDYYSAKIIPAEAAFFVAGSDVMGPMGKDLVPLSSEKEAAGFRRDHGGNAVYRLGEVTEETLRALE